MLGEVRGERGGMARGRREGAARGRRREGVARGGGVRETRGGGRGVARGGRGARSQRRNFVPSTIPWQTKDTDTDSAPIPLTFSETTGPQIVLPSNPHPVDFLSTFLDENVLGHTMDETNR